VLRTLLTLQSVGFCRKVGTYIYHSLHDPTKEQLPMASVRHVLNANLDPFRDVECRYSNINKLPMFTAKLAATPFQPLPVIASIWSTFRPPVGNSETSLLLESYSAEELRACLSMIKVYDAPHAIFPRNESCFLQYTSLLAGIGCCEMLVHTRRRLDCVGGWVSSSTSHPS
jgi:hypothetical protein